MPTSPLPLALLAVALLLVGGVIGGFVGHAIGGDGGRYPVSRIGTPFGPHGGFGPGWRNGEGPWGHNGPGQNGQDGPSQDGPRFQGQDEGGRSGT